MKCPNCSKNVTPTKYDQCPCCHALNISSYDWSKPRWEKEQSIKETEQGKIEYKPPEEPTVIMDGYKIWAYETEGIVPDMVITEEEGDERLKLWAFLSYQGISMYVVHTDHKHPPDYENEDCSKWSYFDDEFPDLSPEQEPPESVKAIVMDLSDAPVVWPKE